MNSRQGRHPYWHAITNSGRAGCTLALLAAGILLSGCKSGASLQMPWARVSAESTADIAKFEEPLAPVARHGPRPQMRQPDSVALASFNMETAARPSMASHPAVGRMVKVNSASFDNEVLQSDVPVLVDFSADYCGPCKRLEPRLQELAREMPQAKVVQVDIQESPELAARYNVGSIPSLRVIRSGKVTASREGLMSQEELRSLMGAPARTP